MKIKGKIESVDIVKQGSFEKNGRKIPYTLYSVVIGGEKFKTFDKMVVDLVGKEGEWEYEEEEYTGRDGKTYTSKKLVLPKDDKKQEIEGKIDSLIEKVDSLSESLKFIADGIDNILSSIKKDEKQEEDDFDVFLKEIE